jgi:dihydrodipicolinate synthase/N-acetylneuraminate lyase
VDHEARRRDARPGEALIDGVATWKGIWPAICTPFAEDGSVDLAAMRRVVGFAIEAGAHGLVCFGLAGEVLKLTSDERRSLIEVIVDEAAGRVPVLAGVGAESLRASIELARHAEQIGVSGLVSFAPTTARPGERAVAEYLATLAGSVSLTMMIQDAPAYLGVALSPTIVARAAELAPNIRMLKLEAGPAAMSGWIDALGPSFRIWGGDGGVYQLDCLRIGATGIVPGVDLVDLLVEIYELEQRGAHDEADRRLSALLPMLMFEMQSIDHYNACAKRVLVQRGVLQTSALRAPAEPFPAACAELLDRHLASLGLAARDLT